MIENTTKAERIYRRLKDSIVTGKLEPGSKLVSTRLAADLNVSEIPVREALKKLESKGLVETIPFTGSIVTRPSVTELVENTEIRSVLQPLAVSLSTPLLTPGDIDEIESLHIAMTGFMKLDDYESYAKKNREFHGLIYSRCPNKNLLKLIKEIRNKTERARAIFKVQPFLMNVSCKEHEEMIQAIKNKEFHVAEEIEKKQQVRVKEQIIESL